MRKEATLETNSSLKLSRWMHAYGQLLRYIATTLYLACYWQHLWRENWVMPSIDFQHSL